MKRSPFFYWILCAILAIATASSSAEDKKLRIICFGAHPDDAEIMAGGVAALWTARGHAVKFVSATNGDIGHWRDAGGPLALRRKAEVERAASILGNAVQVLDIHDGELEPTLENRRTVVRLIRDWKADIVMTHRPNDYHPDHRYTAQLVQDAAFMVSVPFLCPDTPPLPWNPVFLFYSDGFQKPAPFTADIVVDIGPVLDKKLDALTGMESQFYEGGALGSADLLPIDPVKQAARKERIRNRFLTEFGDAANLYRKQAEKWIGKAGADKIKYAEAFEICEYGRKPDKDEIKILFPFFNK